MKEAELQIHCPLTEPFKSDVLCRRTTSHEGPSPILSKDLISISPYCLSYNSYDASLENLVLDQLKIPLPDIFFILVTCLFNIVLILYISKILLSDTPSSWQIVLGLPVPLPL